MHYIGQNITQNKAYFCTFSEFEPINFTLQKDGNLSIWIVLKILPNLRLDVLINFVLIKKKRVYSLFKYKENKHKKHRPGSSGGWSFQPMGSETKLKTLISSFSARFYEFQVPRGSKMVPENSSWGTNWYILNNTRSFFYKNQYFPGQPQRYS